MPPATTRRRLPGVIAALAMTILVSPAAAVATGSTVATTATPTDPCARDRAFAEANGCNDVYDRFRASLAPTVTRPWR